LQYIAIIIPNLGVAVVSLFAYPSICARIGIDSSRALAFPARSITLALATPVVKNLGMFSSTLLMTGGSIPLVVVLAILSGIIGVLVGSYILKLLRIPPGE
jgi:putative effector of murein hydrolase